MTTFKKIVKWVFGILVVLYLAVCICFYFFQEKLFFNTSVKLKKEHVFKFADPFEERYITMPDNKKLNGVLFKAKNPKGLILWFPGGRGIIDSIGVVDAHNYTNLNYDYFVLNFRGYGKSEGKITSEKQFNDDMQAVYNYFKKEYQEQNIILFGYSAGTGPAAYVAANNNPKMLILQAPYFSMKNVIHKNFYYLPTSLLIKYEFPTNEYLEKTKCPVVIIQGDKDKIFPPKTASLLLKKYLKPTDQLIILKDQGHNGYAENKEYLNILTQIIK